MASVPGIKRQRVIERHRPALRMIEPALKISRGHSAKQVHPALMQRVHECERSFHRRVARIAQLSPARFIVWLYGGLVFRKRELEARVGVHVAVRDMMHYLLHGPAAVAIRGMELLARKAADGFAQFLWRLFDL